MDADVTGPMLAALRVGAIRANSCFENSETKFSNVDELEKEIRSYCSSRILLRIDFSALCGRTVVYAVAIVTFAPQAARDSGRTSRAFSERGSSIVRPFQGEDAVAEGLVR
jgi:hypothetical protein